MLKNDQHFNDTRELDNVRRELDDKINGKTSSTTFYWVLGFVITAIGYLYWSNTDLSHKLTVIETRESEREKQKETRKKL